MAEEARKNASVAAGLCREEVGLESDSSRSLQSYSWCTHFDLFVQISFVVRKRLRNPSPV